MENYTLIDQYSGYKLYESDIYGDEAPALVLNPYDTIIGETFDTLCEYLEMRELI